MLVGVEHGLLCDDAFSTGIGLERAGIVGPVR